MLAFGEPGDSPGMTVGYFFIPILNIWKPYAALSNVWVGSDRVVRDDDNRWAKPVGAPRFFVAWWLVWFVSRIVSRFAEGMLEKSSSPEAWISAAHTNIVAIAIELVALGLMLAVVWSITRRQELRGATGLPRATIAADESR